jgi:hypothetical protein
MRRHLAGEFNRLAARDPPTWVVTRSSLAATLREAFVVRVIRRRHVEHEVSVDAAREGTCLIEAGRRSCRQGRGRVSLNPVPGDPFLGAIEDIAAAVDAAREALNESIAPLVSARRRRLAGASMLEIVDDLVAADGPEALRRETARAFACYERAVKAFRGIVIRTLVDEERVSLSEVSRRLSISRQMATRLYDAAGGDTST